MRQTIPDALRGAVPGPMAGAFALNGEAAVADLTGALFLPAHRTLIVSDLHLEKGSSYAERGIMLPPYDTTATLSRLALAIARHAPKVVVALGDSFHDRRAGSRMAARDRDAIRALQAGRDWIWISGNHDPEPPQDLGGVSADTLDLGRLTLRHEPRGGATPGEIAGHLHPVARVWSPAGTVRRRCFATDGLRCVMPAFGAFTGGLNFLDTAFDTLFASARVTAHVLGRNRVYAIPQARCLGE